MTRASPIGFSSRAALSIIVSHLCRRYLFTDHSHAPDHFAATTMAVTSAANASRLAASLLIFLGAVSSTRYPQRLQYSTRM